MIKKENSSILGVVQDIRDIIKSDGVKHKNTLESIGNIIKIEVEDLDLDKELERIKGYYGDRYEARFGQEINHYKQLKYSLIHKLEETKFFFKEGPDSRKNVISSNDCISLIQYIERPGGAYMFVHMRSSDVNELLPLDLYFLCDLLMLLSAQMPKDSPRKLVATIGSAHEYLYDSPRFE